MPEFIKLIPLIEALQLLLNAMPDQEPAIEIIDTLNALDRVLAEDVRAPHPLPEFARSTVDGYAVRARDTFGTSESMPGYLRFVGEVQMGDAPDLDVVPGACALIHTGGMLPKGANAVVMLENTQLVHHAEKKDSKGIITKSLGDSIICTANTEIELSRPVAEGENVLRVGEDVKVDQIVLFAGERMQPSGIGGCMALGIVNLRVAKKPKIGIIASGDEVVSPDQSPRPGQVRDVNSYSLASLVTKAGGEPVLFDIVPDQVDAMRAVAAKALAECEVLVITAGSSASVRDTTAEAIASLGEPGILVHGVNVRPGKPTILAVCNGKAVIGLPGNPVSALVIGKLFVLPVIEKNLGFKSRHPRPSVLARLAVNIPSQAGREDWVAVRVLDNLERAIGSNEPRYLAEPVFTKSNLIFSLVAADGFVCIPPDVTGLSVGEVVEILL